MDMQNNEMKAKAILKKHRIFGNLLTIWLLVMLVGISLLISDLLGKVLCLALCYLLYLLAFYFMSMKDVMFPLTLRLDAPLHYELVKQGKLVAISAIYQIQAEYFVGHYANVIALCYEKLKDTRVNKRWRYYYLSYLANTYFDLGEEERLREVCDRFYGEIASERNKERVFKRFRGFSFFSTYLNRNFEACDQYLQEKTEKNPLLRINSLYLKARVAWLKGDTESAKASFEAVIAEAPLLHYAKLSEAALKAMENGTDYRETIKPLLETETPAPLKPPAASGFLNGYNKVIRIVLIVLIVFCILVTLIGKLLDRETQTWEEYCAEVEMIVEADYGDVEFLDIFDLYDGDFWVDSMFICKTEDSVLIGSVYYYTDSFDDSLYYEIQAEVPIASLLAADFSRYINTYDSVTEYCTVTSGFYKNREDVPEDTAYFVALDVDGKTVYFAVTDVQYTEYDYIV